MRSILWFCMVLSPSLHVSCQSNCHASASTVVSVKKCPEDSDAWTERAKIKNCSAVDQSCTKKENFKYHCVRNAYMNNLLEVCAPVWQSSGFCVEFNEAGERVQDNYGISCKKFKQRCPDSYASTEIFNYPGCYTLLENKRKGSSDPLLIVIFSCLGTVMGLMPCILIVCCKWTEIKRCIKERKYFAVNA
ncbi:uncharacterized protein LOC134282087 [Saccostrea cucullata]|uniref:uncharacterized protein LOC134282087 n=1 Tax=Saccostrea cuccullata TaxID=36930 RepID=UPI002ED0DB29